MNGRAGLSVKGWVGCGKMAAMDPIETPRLHLRDFIEPDWKALHEYAKDKEVVKYLQWGPNSEEQSVNFLRAIIAEHRSAGSKRRNYALAIVMKEEDRLVGGVRLTVQQPEHRNGDIGYVLRRDHWGRGIVTEAASAILDFGFTKLGLHRIYATCALANAPSARVLEKIGMKREGQLREHRFEKGEWVTSYLYSILHREWREQRQA